MVDPCWVQIGGGRGSESYLGWVSEIPPGAPLSYLVSATRSSRKDVEQDRNQIATFFRGKEADMLIRKPKDTPAESGC